MILLYNIMISIIYAMKIIKFVGQICRTLKIRQIHALLLIIMMIVQLQTQKFQYLPLANSESRNVEIYNQIISLPIETLYIYEIPFDQQFTTIPEVMFGISTYTGNDQLRNQLYKFTIQTITQTNLNISIWTSGFTAITFAKISYIAIIDDFNGIWVTSYQFTTFSAIGASATGPISEILSFNPNLPQIDPTYNCQYFLNGVILRSSNSLHLSFYNTHITANKLIQITAHTKPDGYYQMIYLMIVIIKPIYNNINQPIITSMYQYQMGNISIINRVFDDSLINYNITGTFIMGMSGFQGSGVFRYSWQIQNNPIALHFQFDSTVDLYIFTYISLGKIQCIQSHWLYLNRTCVNSCPALYTIAPVNHICLSCQQPCQSCNSTKLNCTTCIDGYQLNNTNQQCILITQPVITTTTTNLTFLLSLLVLIPISLIIIVFCLKKKKTINPDLSMKQHPSIQV